MVECSDGDESTVPVGMRSMFDPTDVQGAVGEDLKGHAVAAAARHPPAFQLEPQRLGHDVRIGGQGFGDELGDGGGHFVRQSLQRPCSAWR